MCLERIKLVKLRKDRVCYKVLAIRSKEFYTSYYECNVHPNMRLTSSIVLKRYNSGNIVEEAIHSFATLSAAKEEVDTFPATHNMLVVMECIIPKTAVFYEGSFGDLPAYASDILNIGTRVRYIKY